MLVNLSYNNPEITRKVDDLLGKPFTLKKRIAMGGIGSPKLIIREASLEIRNLLLLDNNRDTCNIELRPGGIILGFRSLLESYGLIIPYYRLTIFKGDLGVYTVHSEHHFVRVEADTKAVQRFFTKLQTLKAEASPDGPNSGYV
ncbi:hypothetical protein SAMN04490243_2732 [Robiginitalea myxolifaciens]|uniref:Uncharacterized protein n=1 Tax=Robiginitalea myxolifaciens TaxID=400055 RepID=A0A1I6HGR2_9FLAO|nr:hypothetical protein [Robiginitalea myxolifaciens]SFR53683.1 hypothetical protein SAMN04490243_2732 [Robiginitalea myxolifaciens]